MSEERSVEAGTLMVAVNTFKTDPEELEKMLYEKMDAQRWDLCLNSSHFIQTPVHRLYLDSLNETMQPSDFAMLYGGDATGNGAATWKAITEELGWSFKTDGDLLKVPQLTKCEDYWLPGIGEYLQEDRRNSPISKFLPNKRWARACSTATIYYVSIHPPTVPKVFSRSWAQARYGWKNARKRAVNCAQLVSENLSEIASVPAIPSAEEISDAAAVLAAEYAIEQVHNSSVQSMNQATGQMGGSRRGRPCKSLCAHRAARFCTGHLVPDTLPHCIKRHPKTMREMVMAVDAYELVGLPCWVPSPRDDPLRDKRNKHLHRTADTALLAVKPPEEMVKRIPYTTQYTPAHTQQIMSQNGLWNPAAFLAATKMLVKGIHEEGGGASIVPLDANTAAAAAAAAGIKPEMLLQELPITLGTLLYDRAEECCISPDDYWNVVDGLTETATANNHEFATLSAMEKRLISWATASRCVDLAVSASDDELLSMVSRLPPVGGVTVDLANRRWIVTTRVDDGVLSGVTIEQIPFFATEQFYMRTQHGRPYDERKRTSLKGSEPSALFKQEVELNSQISAEERDILLLTKEFEKVRMDPSISNGQLLNGEDSDMDDMHNSGLGGMNALESMRQQRMLHGGGGLDGFMHSGGMQHMHGGMYGNHGGEEEELDDAAVEAAIHLEEQLREDEGGAAPSSLNDASSVKAAPAAKETANTNSTTEVTETKDQTSSTTDRSTPSAVDLHNLAELAAAAASVANLGGDVANGGVYPPTSSNILMPSNDLSEMIELEGEDRHAFDAEHIRRREVAKLELRQLTDLQLANWQISKKAAFESGEEVCVSLLSSWRAAVMLRLQRVQQNIMYARKLLFDIRMGSKAIGDPRQFPPLYLSRRGINTGNIAFDVQGALKSFSRPTTAMTHSGPYILAPVEAFERGMRFTRSEQKKTYQLNILRDYLKIRENTEEQHRAITGESLPQARKSVGRPRGSRNGFSRGVKIEEVSLQQLPAFDPSRLRLRTQARRLVAQAVFDGVNSSDLSPHEAANSHASSSLIGGPSSVLMPPMLPDNLSGMPLNLFLPLPPGFNPQQQFVSLSGVPPPPPLITPPSVTAQNAANVPDNVDGSSSSFPAQGSTAGAGPPTGGAAASTTSIEPSVADVGNVAGAVVPPPSNVLPPVPLSAPNAMVAASMVGNSSVQDGMLLPGELPYGSGGLMVHQQHMLGLQGIPGLHHLHAAGVNPFAMHPFAHPGMIDYNMLAAQKRRRDFGSQRGPQRASAKSRYTEMLDSDSEEEKGKRRRGAAINLSDSSDSESDIDPAIIEVSLREYEKQLAGERLKSLQASGKATSEALAALAAFEKGELKGEGAGANNSTSSTSGGANKDQTGANDAKDEDADNDETEGLIKDSNEPAVCRVGPSVIQKIPLPSYTPTENRRKSKADPLSLYELTELGACWKYVVENGFMGKCYSVANTNAFGNTRYKRTEFSFSIVPVSDDEDFTKIGEGDDPNDLLSLIANEYNDHDDEILGLSKSALRSFQALKDAASNLPKARGVVFSPRIGAFKVFCPLASRYEPPRPENVTPNGFAFEYEFSVRVLGIRQAWRYAVRAAAELKSGIRPASDVLENSLRRGGEDCARGLIEVFEKAGVDAICPGFGLGSEPAVGSSNLPFSDDQLRLLVEVLPRVKGIQINIPSRVFSVRVKSHNKMSSAPAASVSFGMPTHGFVHAWYKALKHVDKTLRKAEYEPISMASLVPSSRSRLYDDHGPGGSLGAGANHMDMYPYPPFSFVPPPIPMHSMSNNPAGPFMVPVPPDLDPSAMSHHHGIMPWHNPGNLSPEDEKSFPHHLFPGHLPPYLPSPGGAGPPHKLSGQVPPPPPGSFYVPNQFMPPPPLPGKFNVGPAPPSFAHGGQVQFGGMSGIPPLPGLQIAPPPLPGQHQNGPPPHHHHPHPHWWSGSGAPPPSSQPN